jgi:arylsulfatase A-like enzyme
VVVTADHGEPLFQRGQFYHGMSLHEEVTRIPLLMLIPARAAGVRRSELVSLMDLAPTLVDLVGLPVPERFIGRSLLRPGTTLDPPRAFGEQPKAGSYSWFAREANWKLLMEPQRAELYELTTDPGETRDVAAEHPIETGYLTSLLRLRVPMLRDGAPGAPPHDAVLTPEARQELHEALKALGYVQ